MFKVINTKTGAEIGVTEKPHFIKKSSTGCFIKATEKKAQGVAYKSKPYNLQGRAGVGAEDTVILIEYDGGDIATALSEQSAVIDSLIISSLEG